MTVMLVMGRAINLNASNICSYLGSVDALLWSYSRSLGTTDSLI